MASFLLAQPPGEREHTIVLVLLLINTKNKPLVLLPFMVLSKSVLIMF